VLMTMWSQNAFILATVLFGSGYAGLGLFGFFSHLGLGRSEPSALAD
jgi:hypothetical protein